MPEDQSKIQGVPEGLIETPIASTTGIEGVPEGLTEEPLHMAGAGGSWEPESTSEKAVNVARKGWETATKPLIPEGRAEKEAKEYVEAAPTLSESENPHLTGAKKGLAGTYADTLGFARGLSSPLGVATMGLGKVAGEVPGAVG